MIICSKADKSAIIVGLLSC